MDPSLESLPTGGTDLWITALGFRWCGAEQQVMAYSLAHPLAHAASDALAMRFVPRFTCSRTAWRAH